MQVGRCGSGIAGFTDIADDLPFFYSLIQADTGKLIQVGIVMPRTRPLNTDNFATQSVAPDFGDDAGRGTAYRRIFLSKNIHTFMPAPLTARCTPSVVKTLAFNGIRQALFGRRLLRPQLFDFGTGARKLFGGTASESNYGCTD